MNEIQQTSMKMLVALINYKGAMLGKRANEPFKLYGAQYLLESLIGVVRITQKNKYETLLQAVEEEAHSRQKEISQQTKTDIYELSVLAQQILLGGGLLKGHIFTIDEFITELEKMV